MSPRPQARSAVAHRAVKDGAQEQELENRELARKTERTAHVHDVGLGDVVVGEQRRECEEEQRDCDEHPAETAEHALERQLRECRAVSLDV